MSLQQKQNLPIADILPHFLEYIEVEARYSPATVAKYRDNIRSFLRDVGNPALCEMGIEHFIALKSAMTKRHTGPSRIGSVVVSLKSLLAFARDILKISLSFDLSAIRAPRPPRREVVYLTPEELECFLNAIPLHTWSGKPRLAGYRFRALCETLAATGMRISEALSLNRDSIDFERRQAVIVGKGNKQRTVFFTDRALQWITRYLDLRSDSNPALFAIDSSTRFGLKAAEAMFRRNTKWAGLKKKVTPHIIRHTTASLLLTNGCPIGFIKEILGHERLETTCRYYLGIMTKADVENAHRTYWSLETNRTKREGSKQTTPTTESASLNHPPLTDIAGLLRWDRYS